MLREVWYRNPLFYYREVAEATSEIRVVYDGGYLRKRNISAERHALAYFRGRNWRSIVVQQFGATEFRSGSKGAIANYPIWSFGDDDEVLEEFCRSNIADDLDFCFEDEIPAEHRPIPGQEHRVVVTDLPPVVQYKAFYEYLGDLQKEFPDTILQMHGTYSPSTGFKNGLRAFDIDVRSITANNDLFLPNGMRILSNQYEQIPDHWLRLFGFTAEELAGDARLRTLFSIKCLEFASRNYDEDATIRRLGRIGKKKRHDPSVFLVPDADFRLPGRVSGNPIAGKAKPQVGDRYLCNTCTLQLKCDFYREGMVCSVPGSEPQKMAEMFGSRSPSKIIDGLSNLMAIQSRRLEHALEAEEDRDDRGIDPEVSKLVKDVFSQATTLAKLIDPGLAGGKVNVNINNGSPAIGAAAVGTASPRELMVAVFAELESRGIAREDITDDMIKGLLTGMAEGNGRQAIEGIVIKKKDEGLI
jgi:hypothetical protein